MERTFVLTRMSKVLCWFQIAVSAVAAALLAGVVVYAVRRWTLGQYASRPFAPVWGIPFLTLLAVLAVYSIRSSFRELSFSLTLSSEAVRIGDVVVPWESISRVFGSYSISRAFFLWTTAGRRFLVPRVEQADLLEDIIRARVIDGATAIESAPSAHLMRYDVSRKVRTGFELASALFWCGAIAGFGTAVRTASELVRLPAVLAAMALTFLACWAWSRAHFSVAVFHNGIRVGDDSVARWDQIAGVEPSRMLGVAFFLRRRDGKKLRVFFSSENARELEDLVRSRLLSGSQ